MRGVGRRIGGRVVAAVAGALAMAVVIAVPSAALWSDRGSASATFSTASLPPPTNPKAIRDGCVVLSSSSIRVSWGPSPANWITGYRVSYGLTAGGPYTASVDVGPGATDVVIGGLGFNLRHYVVVVATKGAWTSTPTAEVSVVTPTALCI